MRCLEDPGERLPRGVSSQEVVSTGDRQTRRASHDAHKTVLNRRGGNAGSTHIRGGEGKPSVPAAYPLFTGRMQQLL